MQGLRSAFHLPVRQAILRNEAYLEVRRNKPAPCFDTGKDEGNEADACLPVGRGVFRQPIKMRNPLVGEGGRLE